MGKGGMSHESSAEDAQEENLAAWLVAVNTLKIQPFKLPPLGNHSPLHFSLIYSIGCGEGSDDLCLVIFSGPHDVKVRMKAVGICGSDVHYLKVRNTFPFSIHQSAGIDCPVPNVLDV